MCTKTFTRTFAALAILLASCILVNAQVSPDRIWTEIDESQLVGRSADRQIVPSAYKTFSLNKGAVISILDSAPEEFSETSRFVQTIVTLPMPDGKFERFRIEHSLVVEPGLLQKFPELTRTYNGRGIDDPTATVRLDFMPHGFHGMILSTRGTVYIDPYAKGDTDHYITYRKTELARHDGFSCGFDAENPDVFGILDKSGSSVSNQAFSDSVINGSQLRTYRLALAATFEYCQFFGGTIAAAQAGMVTTMNRVNGVYEKDVAIRMVLIANNNLIVYAGDTTNCGGVACTAANDPYTNSNGSTMLGQNQTNLDTVILTANYDIGHVFSTGGGGVATLNGPCNASTKARGVTGLGSPTGDGFDIDFVAHEMGHQYSALHTFNGSIGNCSGGNRSASAAYEPGSGITIMAYAGICGADDLAAHSIDTFHVKSLEQIVAFREGGGSCGPATATGNTPPTVSVVGGPTFNIPKTTPFTLSATSSDVNGDSVTYDWQEYDLGPAGPPHTDGDGQARPLFRPYLPLTTGSRTYPSLTFILNNANVPPATTGGFLTGEILPSITRTMTFQVIARDNRANGGGINTATATVNVDGVSGPFAVTAPNTGVTYGGGSTQTVTWNVAGTSGAPVSAANVKLSFSTDGGNTFPTTLLASTPNDGSQLVTIPIGNTTTARIKVEAVGNIFFDVSDVNFTVSGVALPPRSRADFDGDGKTDVSVFRPSEGNWYLNRSTSGFLVQHWGLSGDQLVPGDYDNDGKTDLAVFRPTPTAGTPDFYIFNSATSTVTGAEWGTTSDLPIVGDYDGDGKTDLAIYRPSTFTWYILRSTGGITITALGAAGDVPLSADFDGDGKTDLAVFRASSSQWLGIYSAGGAINTVYGNSGDKVVPADYDGDAKDDFAVYRPSTGTWHIYQSSTGTTVSTPWGISTDIPVPGDYDGDGRDDHAVYRNGVWYVNRSFSGFMVQSFGLSTDTAVPKAYIP
jgi:hypothetical protein